MFGIASTYATPEERRKIEDGTFTIDDAVVAYEKRYWRRWPEFETAPLDVAYFCFDGIVNSHDSWWNDLRARVNVRSTHDCFIALASWPVERRTQLYNDFVRLAPDQAARTVRATGKSRYLNGWTNRLIFRARSALTLL